MLVCRRSLPLRISSSRPVLNIRCRSPLQVCLEAHRRPLPRHPSSSHQQGPAPNGFPGQPPSSTASPGPGKRGVGRPPAGGPATPQINTPMPYGGPGASPQVANHPTPDHRPMQPGPLAVNNALGDLDVERLPAHIRKIRDDWFVILNQDLVHTLVHESVVCCVRFSTDGKYVATGCNRSAQIYDVSSGEKVCVLQDENVDVSGDLYIRSVCFSPDGKYLATGAEDKLIRVSPLSGPNYPHYDHSPLTHDRSGTSNLERSATLLRATSKTSTR